MGIVAGSLIKASDINADTTSRTFLESITKFARDTSDGVITFDSSDDYYIGSAGYLAPNQRQKHYYRIRSRSSNESTTIKFYTKDIGGSYSTPAYTYSIAAGNDDADIYITWTSPDSVFKQFKVVITESGGTNASVRCFHYNYNTGVSGRRIRYINSSNSGYLGGFNTQVTADSADNANLGCASTDDDDLV